MAENQEQQYVLAPPDYVMQQPTSTKNNRQVIYRPVQSYNGSQSYYVQKHPSQTVLQQVYNPQAGSRFVPMQQNSNKMYQPMTESGTRTITVQREVQVEKQIPIKKEVEAFDTVVETVPIVEEIPIIETIIQPVQVPAYKSIVYPLKQSQQFQPQPQPQPQPQQQQPQPIQQEQQPPKEIIKTEIVYKTQMVDNPEHLKKIDELESKIQNLEEEVEDGKKQKRNEQAKRAKKQQEDQQQQRDLETKVRELDEQFQRITMEKEFIMRQLESTKNQNQDLYSNNLELNLAIENLAMKLAEYEKNLSVKTMELSEEEQKNRKLQDQYNDVLQHIVILGIENERLHVIIREGTDENEKLRQSQKIIVKGIVPKQSSQQTIQAIQNQVRQSINPQAFQQFQLSQSSTNDGFKQRNTVASGGVFSQSQLATIADQKDFQSAGEIQKSQFSEKQNKIVFDNYQEKKQYKQQK